MAKEAPTTEEFKNLASKKASVMQKGLATFIAETTGKKVSADMVGIVQRFSAPYRLTEHYADTKAAWTGSRTDAEQARAERKAAVERERVATKRAKLTAELERLGEIEAALATPAVAVEPRPVAPRKPRSKAAKGAAKAAADPKPDDETVVPEPAKPEPKKAPKRTTGGEVHIAPKAPTLTLVPDLPVADDDDEDDEPVEILVVSGSDEFVAADDDDEDFEGGPPAPTTPLITFDDAEDLGDDEDDDDDF